MKRVMLQMHIGKLTLIVLDGRMGSFLRAFELLRNPSVASRVNELQADIY